MKNSVRKLATILTMALLLTSLSGCALPFGLGKPKATPTPMPTPMNAQPRATHTPTPKPTATFTPAPTNTPTPTNTSTPTPTPTNTPTPTDTPTPTPTPCTHIWEIGYDIEVKEVCPLCGREYVSSVTRLYYCALCDSDIEEVLPVTPHVCPTATPTPTATNTPKPTATPTYPPYGTPNEWFTQEDVDAHITYKCYSVSTDYEKGAFFYGYSEAWIANWLENHEKSWSPTASGVIVEGYIQADIAGTSSDMWPAYYANDLADVEGGISDGPLCYIRGGQKGTRVMDLYYRHVYRKKSQQIITAGGLYGIWMTMPDYFDESSDTYTEFMFDLKNPNTRITYVTKDKKTGKVLDTKIYDDESVFEPKYRADNQFINIKYLENMVVLDHDPTKE